MMKDVVRNCDGGFDGRRFVLMSILLPLTVHLRLPAILQCALQLPHTGLEGVHHPGPNCTGDDACHKPFRPALPPSVNIATPVLQDDIAAASHSTACGTSAVSSVVVCRREPGNLYVEQQKQCSCDHKRQ